MLKKLIVVAAVAVGCLLFAAPAMAATTWVQTWTHTYNDGDGTGNHQLTTKTYYQDVAVLGVETQEVTEMQFKTNGPAVQAWFEYYLWQQNLGYVCEDTQTVNLSTSWKTMYPSDAPLTYLWSIDQDSGYVTGYIRYHIPKGSSSSGTFNMLEGDVGTIIAAAK